MLTKSFSVAGKLFFRYIVRPYNANIGIYGTIKCMISSFWTLPTAVVTGCSLLINSGWKILYAFANLLWLVNVNKS